MVDNKEWHKIEEELSEFISICPCQRKIKSIIDSFYSLFLKLKKAQEDRKFDFTPEELIIIAILDSKKILTHGTNIEYPILLENHDFWQWVIKTKDNPNLEDN